MNKVKSLLRLTYVDGVDEDGCTALSWAGKYFKSNDRKSVYLANFVLIYFLSFSARRGHSDVVKVLIANYADVNSKDNLNQTPLIRAGKFKSYP